MCTAGGSADPSVNIQLSTILKKYKEQGVPKENIEKALARVWCFVISPYVWRLTKYRRVGGRKKVATALCMKPSRSTPWV
jgi:hypothetical protein